MERGIHVYMGPGYPIPGYTSPTDIETPKMQLHGAVLVLNLGVEKKEKKKQSGLIWNTMIGNYQSLLTELHVMSPVLADLINVICFSQKITRNV